MSFVPFYFYFFICLFYSKYNSTPFTGIVASLPLVVIST